MYLQNGTLTLRNAEGSDAPVLCRWWNDGRVMAHAGFPNGLGTTEGRVQSELAGNADDRRRVLMIERSGQPIGEMSYTILEGKTAEIGIKICEADEQEKGYGKVLLSMLIQALFGMGCRRIVLDTNLKNLRAQHVYERLGFRRLRVNRGAWVDQLGVSQDSVEYELLPGELVDFTK